MNEKYATVDKDGLIEHKIGTKDCDLIKKAFDMIEKNPNSNISFMRVKTNDGIISIYSSLLLFTNGKISALKRGSSKELHCLWKMNKLNKLNHQFLVVHRNGTEAPVNDFDSMIISKGFNDMKHNPKANKYLEIISI